MGVSKFNGALTAAEIASSRKGITVFKSLTFNINGGGTSVLKNQWVDDSIATTLRPGVTGKFYVFEAAGVKGVHAVRLDNGTSARSFPEPNKRLYFTLLPLALLGMAVALFVPEAPGLTGVGATLALIFISLGLILTRQAKQKALQQFEDDAG
jgi:hypothetical protein